MHRPLTLQVTTPAILEVTLEVTLAILEITLAILEIILAMMLVILEIVLKIIRAVMLVTLVILAITLVARVVLVMTLVAPVIRETLLTVAPAAMEVMVEVPTLENPMWKMVSMPMPTNQVPRSRSIQLLRVTHLVLPTQLHTRLTTSPQISAQLLPSIPLMMKTVLLSRALVPSLL